MTDATWALLIATAAATLINIAGQLFTWLKARDAANTAKAAVAASSENKVAIQEVHLTLNSRLSQLLAAKDDAAVAKESAAHAAGVIAGGVAEAARAVAAAAPTSVGQAANTAALAANTTAMDASTAESQRHSP